MAGKGAEYIGPRIPVRIPPDDVECIDGFARILDINRSEAIRRIIANWRQDYERIEQ